MAKRGHNGGSLGGVERSPRRARADAARRRREEARWARAAGPVAVSYRCICPAAGCKLHEPPAAQ